MAAEVVGACGEAATDKIAGAARDGAAVIETVASTGAAARGGVEGSIMSAIALGSSNLNGENKRIGDWTKNCVGENGACLSGLSNELRAGDLNGLVGGDLTGVFLRRKIDGGVLNLARVLLGVLTRLIGDNGVRNFCGDNRPRSDSS